MLNRAEIIGHLGRDPEIRMTQDGTKIANLAVATTERWNDKAGQRQERTEWHRVVIFGGLAGVAERYLRKGSKVYLAGRIQTRKWQAQDGQDRYSTEIVINQARGELEMLDSKPDDDGVTTTPRNYADAKGYDDWQAPGGPAAQGPDPDDLDDEIPFITNGGLY